jgi:hypothetical protein
MKTCAVWACAFVIPAVASAAVTGYTANPTNNSGDFAAAAAGLSLGVDSSVDFEAFPSGPFITSNHYAGSNGVTLSAVSMQSYFGSGATGGTVTSPFSPGEGPRSGSFGAAVNTGANWALTATFAAPVAGAGFMTVDYFNPWNDNTMTIEAFDGPGATGSLLGSFSAAPFCFQLNYTYFMGVISTAADIRSIRISSLGLYGDGVFIDHVAYTVPSPATIGLLALALVSPRRRR